MREISTKKTGWQKICWDLAAKGVPFIILEVQSSHATFIQELCGAYNGSVKHFADNIQVTFAPPSKPSRNGKLEAELEKLLARMSDPKEHPKEEIEKLCINYITRYSETEDLSERSAEILERLMDILEISVDRTK